MRRLAAGSILLTPVLLVFSRLAFLGASVLVVATPTSRAVALRQAGPILVGTSSIGGTVVATETGRPIRMARVTLNGTAAIASGAPVAPGAAGPSVALPGNPLSRTAISDADGRFRFEGLPTGRFTLDASADQFLGASYGQKKPGKPGTPIDVAEGQRADVTVAMTRGGVISGTVVDESGEPLVSARVRALRYLPMNGFKRLRTVMEARTDDRGAYRLFGLEPGDYLVSGVLTDPADLTIADGSSPAAGDTPMEVAAAPVLSLAALQARNASGPPAYAPTFYPAAATAGDAVRIAVDASVERPGIDIRVIPSHTGSIQGMVTGATDPSLRVQILLQIADAAAEPISMTTDPSADGRFTLPGLAPGPYIVYAQTLPREPPPVANGALISPVEAIRTASFDRLHGRTAVIVDGPRTPPVTVVLRPGRAISGRVAFEMTQRPDPARVRTTITIAPIPQNPPLPAFNTSPQAQTDADGAFTLPGIRPGRYVLRASGPGTLKSATLNGEDTLDVGIEVTTDADVSEVVLTMTDRVSVLSGTLADADGKPATDFTVIVAPTDARLWRQGSRRIATTRPSTAGGYAFRGLPAGEYYVAALADFEPGSQFDPDVLQHLPGSAVRVTISDGSTQTQHLRVVP